METMECSWWKSDSFSCLTSNNNLIQLIVEAHGDIDNFAREGDWYNILYYYRSCEKNTTSDQNLKYGKDIFCSNISDKFNYGEVLPCYIWI